MDRVLCWCECGVRLGNFTLIEKTDLSTFSPFIQLPQLQAINVAGLGAVHPRGFAGGVQGGYNWQAGPVIFGVELEFDSFHARASRTTTALYPNHCCGFTIQQSFHTDWLFTARPRIGFAANNILIYVTGGLAVTDLKSGNTFSDVISTSIDFESATASRTKAGWTVGGGIEFALLNNWPIKADYLYASFGSVSTVGTVSVGDPAVAFPFSPISHSANLATNIVRVGLNYRFNWGAPVIAR